MRSSQRAGACLALLLALLAVVLPAGPARAATVTVSLTFQGPSPATASARAGDTVVFSNSDAVTHTVRAASGNWSLSQPVAPGSSVSYVFRDAGTYRYTDTHGVLSRTDGGAVSVAAAPAPSAAPAPTRAPAPTSSPAAQPARATPRPSSTPAPSATAGSPVDAGLVPLGPLGTAGVPSPSPGLPSSQLPPPDLAAGAAPTAVPQAARSTPAAPAYAAGGLTQGSAHRYGLPAALAVLAVTAVASLLVRLLLAEPAAQAARRSRAPEAGG